MLDRFLKTKLAHKARTIFISGFLCGITMGLVLTFSLVNGTITTNLPLSKLLFSLSFTGLLFLTVANGYDLFTGNTMLLVFVHKKEYTKPVLFNLLAVYFGNLAGCIAFALIIYAVGVHKTFGLEAVLDGLYSAKVTMPIWKMLLMGVLANYMVCMGVHLAGKGKNFVESFVLLAFPIAIFCLLGFEHCVANMFSLFYAVFVNGESVGGALYNLFFVTIGNIVGGVLLALSTKVKTPRDVEKEKSESA